MVPMSFPSQILHWSFCCSLMAMTLLMLGCHSGRTQEPQTFRVMSYNIHHGEGTDGKIDLQRIADLIKREKIDVVGLQEIDRGVERSARRDLIQELSEMTGMEFYFDRNIFYQGGQYGNAVLTRFPVVRKENTHFKMLRPQEQRGILQLTLNVHGRTLIFMDTHIDYRPDDAERQMNVREIRDLVGSYKNLPLILCGDFNSTPDSRIYEEVKEFVDDVWTRIGEGPGLTFPSDVPEKRIDYIWCSKTANLLPLKTWIPHSNASDHLAVVAEFELR
jgi:endonuclease/exonuclease/phosphatase family metal-dependent hydrolase